MKKNVFRLVEAIPRELFDNYTFDFEGNYDKLIKKFRHMSLSSVCLHFLRCRRSCEKKLVYCKVCSRVKENNFYECNAFLNLIKDSTTDEFLNISSSERIDVFLNKPAYFPYCHYKSIGKCSDLKFSVLLEICSLPFALFL